MTNQELCAWLREHSSGIYRPAADAADLIEKLLAATQPERSEGMPAGEAVTKRNLVGYGDCTCILTQYCDGKCKPIFADVVVPAAPAAPVQHDTRLARENEWAAEINKQVDAVQHDARERRDYAWIAAVDQAAKNAEYVYKESCSHTLQAIDYMRAVMNSSAPVLASEAKADAAHVTIPRACKPSDAPDADGVDALSYAEGWNRCREAMMLSAPPATVSNTTAGASLTDAELLAIMDAAQTEWGAGAVEGGLRLHVIKSVLKHIDARRPAVGMVAAPKPVARFTGSEFTRYCIEWIDGIRPVGTVFYDAAPDLSVRDAALEEAAHICDVLDAEVDKYPAACAKAIRALRSAPK